MTRFVHLIIIGLLFLSCNSNSKAVNPSLLPDKSAFTIRKLSFYCPTLKNSPGDTEVYIMDSGKNGAKLLLAAGTHGNEIAGIRAAEYFIKNAVIETGSVFVIPHLNKSGVEAGSRLVNGKDQGLPDSEHYIPPKGFTRYEGIEQRNINRSYPGSDQGGLAQKIAFAVMHLLESENIDIAIDLHEAKPGSDLAWNIVSNPKNLNIAALAVLDLDKIGISMHLDSSPSHMDGLSHREWGNRTAAMSFLIETVNPAQADNPSRDVFLDSRYTLERRVSIHLEAIRHLVKRCNEVLSAPLDFSVQFFGISE